MVDHVPRLRQVGSAPKNLDRSIRGVGAIVAAGAAVKLLDGGESKARALRADVFGTHILF